MVVIGSTGAWAYVTDTHGKTNGKNIIYGDSLYGNLYVILIEIAV
jgi:hypothetical protein